MYSYWIYIPGDGQYALPVDGLPLMRPCAVYPLPANWPSAASISGGWFFSPGDDGYRPDGTRDPNWTPPETPFDWGRRYWTGGSGYWSDPQHWAYEYYGTPGAPPPTVGILAVIRGQAEYESPTITFDVNVICDGILAESMSGSPGQTYAATLNMNGRTITCLADGISLAASHSVTAVNIDNATINTNFWFLGPLMDLSAAGSTINLVGGAVDDDGYHARFLDFNANHQYNDLSLNFNGIDTAVFTLEHIADINFSQVSVMPASGLSVTLLVGNYYDGASHQLICDAWQVSGSLVNNFHMTLNSKEIL